MKRNSRLYFDYASTTPIDARVLKAMLPYFKDDFANPSSLYGEGVAIKNRVETARKEVATILEAHSDEIYFTSGGTEANNLAIFGIFEEAKKNNKHPHFVTTSIEHPSVLECFEKIKKLGGEVSYVPVLENGIVDLLEFKKIIKENTTLVSIAYANNEIGVIQPVREIAKMIRGCSKNIVFHIDACQAPNYLNLTVNTLGVDLMTLDASKMYGPKGVGALYIKRRVRLSPIMYGGSQERGIRPGTENVAGIVGFAESLKIAQKTKEKESARLTKLRDFSIAKILSLSPNFSLNGDPQARLGNNINICFPGFNGEFLVFQLDAKGISVSSVTSCRNLSLDSSSYVIGALGKEDCAKSSLRITLGRFTKKSDVDKMIKTLASLLKSANIKLSSSLTK